MNPAELFRQDSDPVLLAPGDVLFREGEHGEEMFVLIEGTVEVLVGRQVVDTAQPGALLGEMALIDHSPRSATAVAGTPSRLARINLKRFHFLVQQNPYFATHVMQVLAQRLRKMNQFVRPTEPALKPAPPSA